jgi:hypothetical protein
MRCLVSWDATYIPNDSSLFIAIWPSPLSTADHQRHAVLPDPYIIRVIIYGLKPGLLPSAIIPVRLKVDADESKSRGLFSGRQFLFPCAPMTDGGRVKKSHSDSSGTLVVVVVSMGPSHAVIRTTLLIS